MWRAVLCWGLSVVGAHAAPWIERVAALGAWPRKWAELGLSWTAVDRDLANWRDHFTEVSAPQQAVAAAVLARRDALNAEVLHTLWNRGGPPERAWVLRLWLHVPSARAWLPDPSVLAHEVSPVVLRAALPVLAKLPEGVPALVEVAARTAGDAEMESHVLAAVRGREAEFLRVFAVEVASPTPPASRLIERIRARAR